MTVSVVMPFWKRAEALFRTVRSYIDLYSDLDIEIIVVNDGSNEKPILPALPPWPINVVDLPLKHYAKNPCVPINTGVEHAKGDIIILTNPEVVHRQRIIPAMIRELQEAGPTGYVAAACWDERYSMWLCRSDTKSRGCAKLPDNAALHFCSMIYRDFFMEVGGFHNEYRDGQGYEDNDFLWTLHKHGAVFSIRDDLIVEHMKVPKTQWPKGGAERNRLIFENRWGE